MDQNVEDCRSQVSPNREWEGLSFNSRELHLLMHCAQFIGREQSSSLDRRCSEHGETRRERDKLWDVSKLIFELIIYDKVCSLNTYPGLGGDVRDISSD